MAVDGEKSGSDGKAWSFCSMPFWQTIHPTSSSSSSSMSSMHNDHQQNHSVQSLDRSNQQSSITVSSVAKSLIPKKRRLRLDPPNKLYFPYEPGKQVSSAIAITNACKSHVAFKVRRISLFIICSLVNDKLVTNSALKFCWHALSVCQLRLGKHLAVSQPGDLRRRTTSSLIVMQPSPSQHPQRPSSPTPVSSRKLLRSGNGNISPRSSSAWLSLGRQRKRSLGLPIPCVFRETGCTLGRSAKILVPF